jgi:RimJ/RimL family protein N-acetyltransferase
VDNPYLSSEHVALRARRAKDVPVLHAQLYDDLATRALADARAWQPIPDDLAASSPYTVKASSEDAVFFSVVDAQGEIAGEALLWRIDLHNRLADVGLALLPAFRGRGWSVEVLRLLCRYGLNVRGLNRLQLETHVDNKAMERAAVSAGFRQEGIRRQAGWALGAFGDVVLMGVLADEWSDTAAIKDDGQPA